MNSVSKRLLAGFWLCLCSLPATASVADDFSNARLAYHNRDAAQLDSMTVRLQDTPLTIYPRYWRLALAGDQADEVQVKTFLHDFPNEYLSDKIRVDWAKRLAASGRRDEFRREASMVVEPDVDLACDILVDRLQHHEAHAEDDAKMLWFTPEPLPPSCNPAFDALFAQRKISRDEVWRRIQLALDANQLELARYLNGIFEPQQRFNESWLNEMLNKPKTLLDRLRGIPLNRGDREFALAAIVRLSRTDPEAAASELQSWTPQLSSAQTSTGWARIGLHAALRQQPEALSWFAQADIHTLQPDELEWFTRAALRGSRWDWVSAAIHAMNADQQQDPAWRYWLARALKAQDKPVEADALLSPLSLEHNFYGVLARDELQAVVDATTERYQASDSDITAVAANPTLQRAILLYHIDDRADGVHEWNWAVRKFDDRQLLAAAELARREGWFDRAIFAADHTRFIHDFTLRYMAPYRDVTKVYAAQMGLDEAWVYGLIRQESRFATQAHSGVGAVGLMQLMPATANWVARKLGLHGYSPSAVNEVGTNVQLGTYYLRHVLDDLGNQPVLATAAYNAGPGRARSWQASTPMEGAIYAETIPISETRDYVKKVMTNAYYYAVNFGQEQRSLKVRMGQIPARP